MRQTIEQGSGQAFIAKDLRPIRKLEIGRDDQRDPFIQRRTKLKQQLRADRREWDEAQFIQDDEILFERGLQQSRQTMLILRLDQFVD